MRQEPIDFSICVLSYNTRELLHRCLRSIKAYTRGISYDVIVVDNASIDGSADMVRQEFPDVTLVSNQENRWYSGGNNDGLRLARGRYIVFCNADAYLVDNALKKIVSWLDDYPRVIAVEPLQRGDDGHIAPTGSLLNQPLTDAIELTFLSRWFGHIPALDRFRQRDRDRTKNWKTETVSGAFLIARTVSVRAIGGFDERLKLYYTDTDFCRRLQTIGEIWHIGRIGVRHSLSKSTDQLSWWTRSGIYAHDAVVYYWITGRKASAISLWLLLQLNRLLVQGKTELEHVFSHSEQSRGI